MTAVAVVIPSWNTCELLAKCLKALARSSVALEIAVIDNGSGDGSADLVQRDFPSVRLVRNPANEGFARACNQGLALTRAPYVFFLNSDTEVEPGAIELLARFLDGNQTYAGAAPRLLNADGTTQRACMEFPGWSTPLWFATPLERWFPRSRELERYFARAFDYGRDGDVRQPPAAAWLLRRSALESVGGFDDALWLFFNDVDLARRLLRAGGRTRFVHAARVRHELGASTRQLGARVERWHLDRLAYYRKHHGRLAGVWVKLCTTLAWVDFALVRPRARPDGPADPLGPTTRAFARFLRA